MVDISRKSLKNLYEVEKALAPASVAFAAPKKIR
jgi:hypothetical protein